MLKMLIKSRNKKAVIPIVVMAIIILALVVLLLLFGTIFMTKATKTLSDMLDSIGTTNIIIVLIVVLVIIFRKPVEAILMSIVGFLR